jgi:hypothetical protein
MKISICILKDFLKEYQLVMSVQGNSGRTIKGVRFFSEGLRLSNDYLYIGKYCRFFSQSESDFVTLIHRDEILVLHTKQLDEVYNQVADVLDTFNELELALKKCATQEYPLQKMLDLFSGFVNPIFIYNSCLDVVAYTRGKIIGAISSEWDDIIGSESLELSKLCRMNNESLEYVIGKKNGFYFFEAPIIEAFSYHVVGCCQNSEGDVWGHVVLSSNGPVDPFDLEMLNLIETAIQYIPADTYTARVTRENNLSQSILLSLMFDSEPKQKTIQDLYTLNSWPSENIFYVMVIRNNGKLDEEKVEMKLRNMEKIYCDRFICVRCHQEIVLLIRDGTGESILPKLIDGVNGCSASPIGISLKFTDLTNFQHYYRQAKDALLYGLQDTQASVYWFFDYAVDFLLEIDRSCKKYCLHPLIKQLKNYDSVNHTDLKLTLMTYLLNERNMNATAAQLYLHRNTVKYRINKINECFSPDLDNAYERLYLLISGMIDP